MFGLMPIECMYDNPACLGGGGGWILTAGDVFDRPYNKIYGFDRAPGMQALPLTGYILPHVNDNLGLPLNNANPNAIVNNLLSQNPTVANIQATASAHPLLTLAVIAGAIYLITK